jgi:hypothetical protein
MAPTFGLPIGFFLLSDIDLLINICYQKSRPVGSSHGQGGSPGLSRREQYSAALKSQPEVQPMAILKIVAGTTAPVCADPAEEFFKQHDPALRAISAHRQATKIFDEAVSVEGESHGKVTKAAYARLEEITKEAADEMFAAARSMVTAQPTTLLGAIALLQYLATNTLDIQNCVDCMPDEIDGEEWPRVFFRTLAAALMEVQS